MGITVISENKKLCGSLERYFNYIMPNKSLIFLDSSEENNCTTYFKIVKKMHDNPPKIILTLNDNLERNSTFGSITMMSNDTKIKFIDLPGKLQEIAGTTND